MSAHSCVARTAADAVSLELLQCVNIYENSQKTNTSFTSLPESQDTAYSYMVDT